MTEPAQAPDLWPDSPWADDASPAAKPAGNGSPSASWALLKPSLVLLVASTIMIFFSAVASSNAAANSPLEQMALVVHRTSMFAMLLAFVGILAAHRLPIVVAFLKSRRLEKATVVTEQRLSTPGLLTADLWFLLMASGGLIAWVWITTWWGHAWLYQLTTWMLLVSAGLLANMAFLHKGCVRSFAIGTLVPMILVLFSWRSMLPLMMINQGGFAFGRGTNLSMIFVNFGIEVTLSLISGLVCGFYYNFVMRVRSGSLADDAY